MNWPDPNRPGVPMFSDREGWHVMEQHSGGGIACAHWNGQEWGGGDQVRALNTSPERYRYVGPVLTPEQIATVVQEAREKERKVMRTCQKELWFYKTDDPDRGYEDIAAILAEVSAGIVVPITEAMDVRKLFVFHDGDGNIFEFDTREEADAAAEKAEVE